MDFIGLLELFALKGTDGTEGTGEAEEGSRKESQGLEEEARVGVLLLECMCSSSFMMVCILP